MNILQKMGYKRAQYSEVMARINEPRSKMQVIVGPRQVGNVTTLAGYLHLLDECGLLCGLQKYAEDDARKYNSIPKFQVHNNALRNVYADKDFMEMAEDPKAWGRYVESAVGALYRKPSTDL